MTKESFFESEARLAVHLVSLFCPLTSEFIARFADDLSWPGLALNQRLDWSEAFLVAHRARFDPHRLFQNPAIVWTPTTRALFGASTASPPVPYQGPEATTIGDVLVAWARATLDKTRPLASLTCAEAEANPHDFLWEPLLNSSLTPWTTAWSRAFACSVEEPHRNVSNVALALLRRIHDEMVAPELGANPEAFLERFFAREPHYDACAVSVDDVHGVLPTVQIDASQIDASANAGWKAGEPVPVAVNFYAQGPRRSVPMGDVQVLAKGLCIVIDRAWRETFASLVLPPHAFHEVTLKPTKKLAGEPLVLRFDDVFLEGAQLAAPYDLFIARRASRGARFFGFEIIVSRRAAHLLREKGLPNVTFSSARVMRFSIAEGAEVARPLASSTPVEALELTEAQSFFAAKRARMMAKAVALPSTYEPKKGVLGQAEKRLARVFPDEFASLEDVQKARIKRRGYRLLSPSKMYLLDQHGYELEHPESWGAVAVAENGVGDCLGLLLRKDSDVELGATLHEFMHETGRVKRWPMKL